MSREIDERGTLRVVGVPDPLTEAGLRAWYASYRDRCGPLEDGPIGAPIGVLIAALDEERRAHAETRERLEDQMRRATQAENALTRLREAAEEMLRATDRRDDLLERERNADLSMDADTLRFVAPQVGPACQTFHEAVTDLRSALTESAPSRGVGETPGRLPHVGDALEMDYWQDGRWEPCSVTVARTYRLADGGELHTVSCVGGEGKGPSASVSWPSPLLRWPSGTPTGEPT